MREKQEIRIVQGVEKNIEYILTRKAVKNLNMRIKPDGKIMVSASPYVSISYIDDFVLSHEKAIRKALEKYKNREEVKAQPMKYISGEKIRILGKTLHLLLEEAKVEGVDWFGQFLILRVKDTTDFMRKERVMKKWMKKKEREIFEEICREMYPFVKYYGVKYPLIRIRDMKSRWGSCQPQRGIITLNGKMLAVPREAIEYVVLHELVHFIHPNHSKDFYAEVEKWMPDWKERKSLLESWQ